MTTTTAAHPSITPDAVHARSEEMATLLRLSLRFPSVSGNEEPYTRMLAQFGRDNGLDADVWQANEAELTRAYGPLPRHTPLANRPTCVLTLRGNPALRSLLFNGHTDVVDAPEPRKWTCDPWSGHRAGGGVVFGRGACDVKGPIVSALWAMLALRDAVAAEHRGHVGIELIPGEEDCVGLGTRTSILRGHRAAGVIVLEPTESLPRNASRGGCRFEVIAAGTAVHGTVKWLGADAIASVAKALRALGILESRWNDRAAADPLFTDYPLARPVTVDRIDGGRWQGMVCDRCTCAGYLELLPGDDVSAWKTKFCDELAAELRSLGEDPSRVRVEFSEEYAGHHTPAGHALCRVAEQVVTATAGAAAGVAAASGAAEPWTGWRAFNSGCEAGARANLLNEPTLVWGPGTLRHAHAVDERIDLADVELTAARFAEFALRWADPKEGA